MLIIIKQVSWTPQTLIIPLSRSPLTVIIIQTFSIVAGYKYKFVMKINKSNLAIRFIDKPMRSLTDQEEREIGAVHPTYTPLDPSPRNHAEHGPKNVYY